MAGKNTEELMEYPKIETLFERNKETFVVDETKLKRPVLATISEWDVTEKIDGTNIRITLKEDGTMTFGGRTENAQLQSDLVAYLFRTFRSEKLQSVLWIDGKPVNIVLYGEGYGPGIQKCGGLYRADKAFILFDVLVGDRWWLGHDAVRDIAQKLGIDAVPYLGRMKLGDIVYRVKIPFQSAIGTAMAEGVVARPIEPLYDKYGRRIIIKLKTKDFVCGKR